MDRRTDRLTCRRSGQGRGAERQRDRDGETERVIDLEEMIRLWDRTDGYPLVMF